MATACVLSPLDYSPEEVEFPCMLYPLEDDGIWGLFLNVCVVCRYDTHEV